MLAGTTRLRHAHVGPNWEKMVNLLFPVTRNKIYGKEWGAKGCQQIACQDKCSQQNQKDLESTRPGLKQWDSPVLDWLGLFQIKVDVIHHYAEKPFCPVYFTCKGFFLLCEHCCCMWSIELLSDKVNECLGGGNHCFSHGYQTGCTWGSWMLICTVHCITQQ